MHTKRLLKSIARALASLSFVALLAGFAPGLAPLAAAHDGGASEMGATGPAGGMRADALAPKNARGYWACPMHPEIHAHEPGKCPVCKMKLVRVNPKNV